MQCCIWRLIALYPTLQWILSPNGWLFSPRLPFHKISSNQLNCLLSLTWTQVRSVVDLSTIQITALINVIRTKWMGARVICRRGKCRHGAHSGAKTLRLVGQSCNSYNNFLLRCASYQIYKELEKHLLPSFSRIIKIFGCVFTKNFENNYQSYWTLL